MCKKKQWYILIFSTAFSNTVARTLRSDSKTSHAEVIMYRENFYTQQIFKLNLFTLARDDLSPTFS